MTDEEKNEEQTEGSEVPVDETVDSGQSAEVQDEAPEADAPAEEAPAEEAPAEEAPAEQAPPEEAPAEEAPAPEEAPEEPAQEAPAGAGAIEPEVEAVEQPGPKERRRTKRSRHSGEASPQRSVEDRARERIEARRKKAAERTRWRQKSRERRRAQPSAEPPAAVEHASAAPRVRQGIVISDRADKTITVKIETVRQHRMYGKVMRTSSNLHAHDESNDAHIGDTVRVVESRPISRLKRWRLVEVLERAR